MDAQRKENMNQNIVAAQILLQDGAFLLAKELLEETEDEPKALYYRSLLHRYYDEYAQELDVVRQALNIDQTNAYMNERLAWHASPLQSRLEPRQTLHLPVKNYRLPSQEMLNNMCFVTSSCAHGIYFGLLVQQIESIKATHYYKEIPICILDAGLTDDQKHLLISNFEHLTIKDPLWDLDMPEDTHPMFKSGLARAFMDQHFPDYRYYMWLSNDTWVQDENSIHDFLYEARLHGAGLVLKDDEKIWHQESGFAKINAQQSIYPKAYDDFLRTRHHYTCGAFCIDATTNFFTLWRESIAEVHKDYGFKMGHEKITFVYAAHKYRPINSIQPLDHSHCFSHRSEGLPVLSSLPGVLYVPSTLNPVGIFNFDNDLFVAANPVLQLCSASTALDPGMCSINQALYQQQATQSQTQNQRPDVVQLTGELAQIPLRLASCHYRNWPSKDKDQILQLLQAPIVNSQSDQEAACPKI